MKIWYEYSPGAHPREWIEALQMVGLQGEVLPLSAELPLDTEVVCHQRRGEATERWQLVTTVPVGWASGGEKEMFAAARQAARAHIQYVGGGTPALAKILGEMHLRLRAQVVEGRSQGAWRTRFETEKDCREELLSAAVADLVAQHHACDAGLNRAVEAAGGQIHFWHSGYIDTPGKRYPNGGGRARGLKPDQHHRVRWCHAYDTDQTCLWSVSGLPWPAMRVIGDLVLTEEHRRNYSVLMEDLAWIMVQVFGRE